MKHLVYIIKYIIKNLFCSEERTSLFVEDLDGKRVLISVYIGPHGSHHKYVEEKASYCTIAVVSISGKTKWEMLDAMVRRAFKVLLLFCIICWF